MSTRAAFSVSGSIVYDTLVYPADDANWGTTTFVETIECQPGGNGANTSLALAKIGTPVRVAGSVGNDDQGRFVLDALRRSGVDTRFVAVSEAATAATVAMVNRAGEREFSTAWARARAHLPSRSISRRR